MSLIPFEIIDWQLIPSIESAGELSSALSKTKEYDNLKIRMVEYKPGYLADHWCTKGHIVHCLKGRFRTELEKGESYWLTEGMTYVVSNEMSKHKSYSDVGVLLLIIDGSFLEEDM